MPSASFSHAVAVPDAPGPVWDRMQDPEVWVGVGPIERVHSAELARDGSLLGYRWNASIAGRSWQGTARTSEAVRGESMRLALDSPEVRATVTARLSPNGEGTQMEVEIQAASRGMLAGLFWGLIEQSIRGSLPEQAEAFARRVSG